MRFNLLITLLFILGASPLLAQDGTFTGVVAADFPATHVFSDPIDVAMPTVLSDRSSGFDVVAVAISYDFGTDELRIGLDMAAIAGDGVPPSPDRSSRTSAAASPSPSPST